MVELRNCAGSFWLLRLVNIFQSFSDDGLNFFRCLKNFHLDGLIGKVAGDRKIASAADSGDGEHVHQRQQIDVVARLAAVPDGIMADVVHFRIHPEIEWVVDIVGSEAVFAYGLRQSVLAVRMVVEFVLILEDDRRAARG